MSLYTIRVLDNMPGLAAFLESGKPRFLLGIFALPISGRAGGERAGFNFAGKGSYE
jgi:hypothetical protein